MAYKFNPFTSNLDLVSEENIIDGTTQGQMAFWDGSTWTYTETSELFWDDTNKRVGIGTDSPSYGLDLLNKNIRIRSNTSDADFIIDSKVGFDARIFLRNSGSSKWVFGNDNNNGDAFTIADWANFDNDAYKRFVIDNDGNVGIGTTDPANELHVQSADGSTRIRIDTRNATPNGGVTLYANTTFLGGFLGSATQTEFYGPAGNYGVVSMQNNSNINFSRGDTGVRVGLFRGDNNTWTFGSGAGTGSRVTVHGVGDSSATSALSVINLSTTSLLHVRNDGNVGIGTAIPGAKLDVVGAAIRQSSTVGGAIGTYTFGQNDVNRFFRGNTSNFTLGSAFRKMRFDYTGTGTISTLAADGTTGLILQTDVTHTSGNILQVANNGAVKVTVDYAGNVGIGTDSPSQALDLIGSLELEDTTTSTTGVIYKDTEPWLHNFSHPTGDTAVPIGHNIFLGKDVGNFTMGSTATSVNHGSYNIGIGDEIMQNVTTGAFNIGIGDDTLKALTIGTSNVAIGRLAMSVATEAINNTAIGIFALRRITDGEGNFGLGFAAGEDITTGNHNTCIGGYAGSSFQTTTGNVALGFYSFKDATGNYNVGIGHNAFRYLGASSSNVGIGTQVLYGLITGNYNVAMGQIAGRYIADGSTANTLCSNSVFIGYDSRALADNQTNQIVIGHTAIGNGSNTATIGNSSLLRTYLTGVNLSAGTATAGTAPLKFTAGTALTTPETGAVEFHDSRFYVTNVLDRKAIARANDVVLAPVTVANTTTETTVYTGIIAANNLKAGNHLDTFVCGQLSTFNAVDSVTFNIYLGSTLISTATSTPKVVTNVPWHAYIYFTVRTTGASGTVSAHTIVEAGGISTHSNNSSTVVDTTTAQNLTVKVQWDVARAANTITLDQGITKYNN